MTTTARDARPDDWWKSAVVYQVYPRSFADSNGDGVGDIRGIIDHLDHLQGLGVDVVWLSPVYRSPQDDNGYDISDYRDIDPLFGTLADLDELIAQLHERGMKLMMDLVVNHTSDEHEWFQQSRAARPNLAGDGSVTGNDSAAGADSAAGDGGHHAAVADDKADWYIWRPAREGFEPGTPGAEPTTWRSAFSGPAWTYDEQRGMYYLHLFSVKQPDLNWENPAVHAAVHDMMRWWVARGVDGFRMDVINFISKRYPLTDDSTFVDGPRMDEFFQEMHREVLAGQNLITVGETPGVSVERASSYTDPTHHEIGMVFQFEHMGLDEQPGQGKWALKPLHLPDLKHNFARWQQGLEGQGWNSNYWNNHDQPRIVSRWGDDSPEFRVASAKTLATVLHLLKGTPYIYQGEEIGMTNAGFTSIEQYRDLEVLNHYAEEVASNPQADREQLMVSFAAKARDNARTPVQWTPGPHAGFTTGTPWIEVNPNHTSINVEHDAADPNGVFAHYQALIRLRHEDEVVREGIYSPLALEHEQLFAYLRSLPGRRPLLVLANMSSEPLTLPAGLPDTTDADELLSTHPSASGSGEMTDAATLQPWESRVLRLA